MIAYNKILLDNTLLVDEALNLKNSGFINQAQYKEIYKKLPILIRHKNISIRSGFFSLGIFLYSSICGMLSLFFANFEDSNYEIMLLVYSLIGFVGKELFTRGDYFGYGLDDMFIIGAEILFFVTIGSITNENYLVTFICMAIVTTLSYLRYIHLSSIVMACIGFTGSLAYLMFEFGTLGKSILPFVMMLFAATLYYLSKRTLNTLKSPYYSTGIRLANSFSQILFYLSGNYMVVRELSIVLLKKDIPPTQEIPFSIFFYTFTLIIPVFYLVYSLIKRDRPMLWIGFIALCFSIYTIRYYHHILPIEVALTFGGLALFAFTYFSIKKIKNNETGITFLPDRFSNTNSQLNLETVIIVSQFGLKPEIKPEESPMSFGGGDFSGGGSSGEF